tara:strand:- start:879 stop:1772 length:894 start_codon:yes stop_codon:yes gene_type:complete
MDNTILAVGSIALDSLQTPNGNRSGLVGGSATYFSIAASRYTTVNAVGVVGSDFPQIGWDLFSQHNINTENVQVVNGKTFSWGGKYNEDYSTRETQFTDLGVFETFSPTISSGVNSKYVFLGNIQPGLQSLVKRQVATDAILVLDTMNLWIDNNLKEVLDVISDIDIFLLNDEEALLLTKERSLRVAGEKLLTMGPKTVIIKQGAHGSTMFNNNQCIYVPSVPNINVLDPTGAGDSFAGGFVGYLAKHNDDDYFNAIIHGTAIASFTVSGFGVEGLVESVSSNIVDRVNLIKRMCDE